MDLIAVLPAALCALACLVAFAVDLLLIPADRGWAERLEVVEVPLAIAVTAAVTPGLFTASDTVILLFSLGGTLLLARYAAEVLRRWRAETPKR